MYICTAATWTGKSFTSARFHAACGVEVLQLMINIIKTSLTPLSNLIFVFIFLLNPSVCGHECIYPITNELSDCALCTNPLSSAATCCSSRCTCTLGTPGSRDLLCVIEVSASPTLWMVLCKMMTPLFSQRLVSLRNEMTDWGHVIEVFEGCWRASEGGLRCILIVKTDLFVWGRGRSCCSRTLHQYSLSHRRCLTWRHSSNRVMAFRCYRWIQTGTNNVWFSLKISRSLSYF